MFIPIGDTPNPKSYTAWMNWMLISVNVGIYILFTVPLSMQPASPRDPVLLDYLRLLGEQGVAQIDLNRVLSSLSAYDLFVYVNGYKPGEPRFASLFTSMFLHSGLAHLGGNMLFLWIFGNNVEHRLGRGLYLVTYLLTGVLATLAFAAFAGDAKTPLVGASGAISGVLGLYFLMFRRNKVKVFVFLFPFIMDVWLVPVRWVLGFYLLIDNLLPFVVSAQSNVAHGAHIGGFVAGLAIGWGGERFAWFTPRSARKDRKPSLTPQIEDTLQAPTGADFFDEIRGAIQTGDQHRVQRALNNLERGDLAEITPEQCVVLADWLGRNGMLSAAQRLLRRCIAANPKSDELARVYLQLGLLSLEQGQPTAAYQHLVSVFDFRPDPATAQNARAALERINVYKHKPRA